MTMPEVVVNGKRWMPADDYELLKKHLREAHERINLLEQSHAETVRRLSAALQTQAPRAVGMP